MNPKYNKKAKDFICCWIETENSLEKDYICKTFNIDPKRFLYIKFDHTLGAEETLDLIQSILETGTIDLFCINSLKCLVPTVELESSLNSMQVGLAARLNAKMTRKFTSLVADNDTAFILITHLSTEIGSMSRDNLIVTGGHAIRYWSALTLDFRKRAISPQDPITKEEGIKVSVTVKKNHCTPAINPYKKIEYFAIFGEGIEQYLTGLQQAIELGIVESKGAWIYWYKNGEIYQKYNGKQAFREAMKNDDKLWKEFSQMLDPNYGIENLSDKEIEEIEKEENNKRGA